ncbi:MAG: zinc-ribbon domain-containing protein, partial [Armatimonadota bacterium]
EGKVDLLTISTKLDELSTALHEKMKGDFAHFGVELVNFFLQSVDVPEEDSTVVSLKKMLAEKAEIAVLGADNYRMKRTFDTMEKAAGSEGGGMGAGMGLGMGFGAGGTMGQMMAQAIGTQAPKQVVACAKCSAQIAAASKFCPECGAPVITATGKCPDCHQDVAAGAKFCNNCGKKL